MFVNYKCENFICVYLYTINKKNQESNKRNQSKNKNNKQSKKKPQKNNN